MATLSLQTQLGIVEGHIERAVNEKDDKWPLEDLIVIRDALLTLIDNEDFLRKLGEL